VFAAIGLVKFKASKLSVVIPYPSELPEKDSYKLFTLLKSLFLLLVFLSERFELLVLTLKVLIVFVFKKDAFVLFGNVFIFSFTDLRFLLIRPLFAMFEKLLVVSPASVVALEIFVILFKLK